MVVSSYYKGILRKSSKSKIDSNWVKKKPTLMFWSLHRLFNSFSYDFNQNHTKSYTLNKRREMKYDIKLKDDMISIYIDRRHDISKLYKQRINGILRDYERFSLFFKPEELQSYLNFKFSSDAEFKNKWKIKKEIVFKILKKFD